ncbi:MULTISPECIES: hypothetical protein [Enterobacteriaceae]|nr:MULTISPECIES: hypothetical protein [Enterobacteriaceae]MCA7030568.1 hypothetical protein [Escherichia coli]MCA7045202.1 hypothetical protein [Escherichia coli]MCA7135145.1 hypothetical protein [Escherichia coli]MCA7155377.1 hypothetical protein [Escherichia coli]MCA7189554.1 hypothetical protein [Escherichia coli]
MVVAFPLLKKKTPDC